MEFKVIPSRSIGVFVIVYAIKVELTDFKVKKFKVTSDQYLELLVDKEYRFYINNNEVKEYASLDDDYVNN